MGIVKITESAIARSKPPKAGWNYVKVEAYGESDSKDKKSINRVFDLIIIKSPQGDDQLGRYCYARFNSLADGMMVSSGFLPACFDKSVDDFEPLEFDPKDLIGKEMWCETYDGTYQGKIQKKTERFTAPGEVPF